MAPAGTALPRIREVSAIIAAALAKVAYDRGLSAGKPPADLLSCGPVQMYEPQYSSYV